MSEPGKILSPEMVTRLQSDMPDPQKTFNASFSKDWCKKMAQLEGDSEIGAGLIAIDPHPDLPKSA